MSMSTHTSETIQLLTCAPPHLIPWIEQVWWSRGQLPTPCERVLPSATADIVVNLGPPMLLIRDDRVDPIVGTTVTGLITRPITLQHPHIHEAIGARLKPLGVRAVLGVPGAVVRDEVVDLSELVAQRCDTLAQVCHQHDTPQARLSAAVSWLSDQIAASDAPPDPLVQWAVAQIVSAHGAVSIRALQDASGYSATWFNQRFRDELGVTPKQLARLSRFRAALDGLAPDGSLAQLALRVGYTDQAHMHRDFRLLAGTSPMALLATRYTSGLSVAI